MLFIYLLIILFIGQLILHNSLKKFERRLYDMHNRFTINVEQTASNFRSNELSNLKTAINQLVDHIDKKKEISSKEHDVTCEKKDFYSNVLIRLPDNTRYTASTIERFFDPEKNIIQHRKKEDLFYVDFPHDLKQLDERDFYKLMDKEVKDKSIDYIDQNFSV